MRAASSSTPNLTPISTPTKGAPAPALCELAQLDEATLRALAQSLIERIAADAKNSTSLLAQRDAELLLRQTKIDALTHEIRGLRHFRFAAAYFSPSWTAFQADRGRDFSVIVDGISN